MWLDSLVRLVYFRSANLPNAAAEGVDDGLDFSAR